MRTVEFVTSNRSVLDMPFFSEGYQELKEAFDKGKKNIVLCSDGSLTAVYSLLNYALSENSAFSRVIYAAFDREGYLYTDSMKHNSIDTVLKNALCRQFLLEDCINKSCKAENYLLRFEEAADENTLVIIDGYDIAAPSPYMRHLFKKACGVVVISDKCMKSLSEDVCLIKVNCKRGTALNTDTLTDNQKELLMTLCAMLEYLDESIPIVSSQNGVFDKNSVRFYFGALSDELDTLEKFGFVTILNSGRVYIEKKVRKQVLNELAPNAENCRTFMNFAERVCDFRITQNVKDISAQLFAFDENYNSFSSSLEFMSVYTHFSKSDNQSGIRVYNMLVSHMLENLGLQEGTLYSQHHIFKNIPYYLSLLCEKLRENSVQEKIYDDELYMDEPLPEIYSKTVKSQLDIIRLCLSYIRNMTIDMYKRLESVFENLHRSMTDIFCYVEKCGFDSEMKMAVLDDVVRLCSESFDHFCAVDNDGVYNSFHDSFDKRRIFYNCERECDKLSADSIPFGYSELTLKLYSVYSQYLSEWLKLAEQTETKYYNTLLKQLHLEKLSDRTKTLQTINAHFVRFASGYENFTDIYAHRTCGPISEKRILDNKRYLSRGFDGGTSRGAERYTDGVLSAMKESKAPLRIALTVLSPMYPLSDEAFGLLVKKEFAQHLCKNKNMPNLSLQILLETLVCDYSEAVKRNGQRELYEYLILYISDFLTTTETHLERMYHTVSTMYVNIKKNELLKNGKLTALGFSDKLYEKFCVNKKYALKYCDDYIANAMFSSLSGEKVKISRSLIEGAIKTHCLESRDNTDECKKLFEFLCK